jgi:hypothetical protein
MIWCWRRRCLTRAGCFRMAVLRGWITHENGGD